MAKKPTLSAAAAADGAGQQTETTTKARQLTVSDERMDTIMQALADTLDDLHTTTLEDIIAGRQLILNAARQLAKDNPQMNRMQFIAQLTNDLQQYLVRNFPGQLPVGEA